MTTVAPLNPRASVPATFVEDFGESDTVNAGDFHFAVAHSAPDGPPVSLLFGCPCGCGALNAVSIAPREGSRRPVWQWDGNEATPTLTPSILIHQLNERAEIVGEHWHGYLTEGVFRSC